MKPTCLARHALLVLMFGAVACLDVSSPEPEIIIDWVEPPFVTGQVSAIDASRGVLVDREGGTGAELSVYVHLAPATRVYWKLDGMASEADIVVGRRVMVWRDGPVIYSLPPQVTAGVVVIDASPGE